MSADLYIRLGAILLTIALGAALQRSGVLSSASDRRDVEPGYALAQLAMLVLVPALLFRTIARLDLSQMPWPVVQAYFVPVMVCCALLLVGIRWTLTRRGSPVVPAATATRAMSALYGNAVQMGIPLATAMFGERGLAIHVALVSLHGLILLTSLTLVAEVDLARARPWAGWLSTLGSLVRSALLHPVVLPVLLGLMVQGLGLRLHPLIDQVLAGLGQAGVPVCLLLIGMNLAHFGLSAKWRPAILPVMVKLLVLPAVVLWTAHQVFGLNGLGLQVVVMMAALPVGSNALIFAQRYRLMQAEATCAIVLSTLAFAVTAPAWLWWVSRLATP